MRFISLFNTKTASLLCLLIALGCRIVNTFFVSFIGKDKMVLMQQSRNLLEGKGLAITRYFVQHAEIPVYDFTPFWPPGYPVLLAPFLKIFNYDIYWTTTAVDLIFAVAFIFLVRKIVLELNFPVVAANIITLIAGCFEYPFIYESSPTDMPAFVLFLIGLLFLIKVVHNEELNYTKLILTSVLLFLPCAFRYSYPPLSIAAPIAVIFLGWYLKKKILIKKGLISLVFVSFFIITFLIILKSMTGSAGYVVETGRGFFPGNIIHWAPFIFESFINAPFITIQLKNTAGISPEQSLNLLEVINSIMMVCLLCVFLYLFFKKLFFKSNDYFRWFLLFGIFISSAACLSLSFLTVTNKPQTELGFEWNYQIDSRYFAFINLYLQIAFIGWVFLYPSWKKNIFQKTIVCIFSTLLFIEITHNIYFYTKAALNPAKYSLSPTDDPEDPDYDYFIRILQSTERNNPGAEIYVVADNDEMYPLMANYFRHKGIYEFNLLTSTLPWKKQTILILALYDPEMKSYQPFLDAEKTQFLNRINNVNFYKIYLRP